MPSPDIHMADTQAERSRLLNRQKKDRTELEKDVKKKKGAMKTAAQAQLEELESAQAAELAEFDKVNGLAGPESPSKEAIKPAPTVVSKNLPTDIEWADLSKKELQEECALRGLSKGGGREELVTRLICWVGDVQANGGGEQSGTDEDDDDDEDDEDEDSEDEDGDESDDMPDMTEEQKSLAEKQYKRELIVRKAIVHLFESKFPEGFPLDDLPEYLARIKVVNFKPETLGYSSLHEFARKQPREAIFYDKGLKWLKPVHLRSDKKGGRK